MTNFAHKTYKKTGKSIPDRPEMNFPSANIPESTTRGATHGTHIILGEISPSVLEPWLGPEI